MTIASAIRSKASTACLSAVAIFASLTFPGAAQAEYRDADFIERAFDATDLVGANAENIRKLDIMFMVTSLHCRNGGSDFQADYAAFTAAHLPTLNRATSVLRRELAYRHGEAGAVREMDRSDVSMANEFGEGHPWLSCHELRSIARDLAADRNPVRLSHAADELLATYPVYAQLDLPRRVANRR